VSSGAYELLLRFEDGREELRLTDHLPRFSRGRRLLVFRDRHWRVEAATEAASPAFAGRLVCVADPDSGGRSS
jgi:hypothetical protein